MTYIHVQTLKDLAACSVAKHFDCNDLLTTISTLKSPLDGHMLQRICRYAFPEAEEKFKSFLVTIIGLKSWTWSAAGALLDNDSVRESLQVGFLLVARVADSYLGQSVDSGANVVIKSEKQTIVSASCSLCTEGPWCKHTLAAVLYRMRYPEKVPVHAPLTEILSSLSRNQLERLLHITIKNTNGAIIMPLWRTIEELEDQHSEINLSRGVPDPTFEESEETEVFWNQVLNMMKENLHETAQFGEKGLRYSDGGCEESEFDFRAKPKAWYLSYLRKIQNLLHIGEIEKAGSALAALASSSYQGYESMAIGNAAASRLRYFCDELQIWCACFILSFDGKGREVLKDTVSALHSSSRTSKFVREMKSTSLFTDLHSIEIPLQRGRSVDFQQPLSEPPEPPPPCLFLNAVRAYDIKVVHPDVADIEVK